LSDPTYKPDFDDKESEQWEDVDEDIDDARRTEEIQPE
jgi:hypothetical protein